MAVVVSVMAGLYSGSFALKSMTGSSEKSKTRGSFGGRLDEREAPVEMLQKTSNPSAGSENPSNSSFLPAHDRPRAD